MFDLSGATVDYVVGLDVLAPWLGLGKRAMEYCSVLCVVLKQLG